MSALLVVGLIVAGSLAGDPAAAASRDPLTDRIHVVVRAYDSRLMAGSDWQVALAHANTILASAGIDVDWVSCGVTNDTPMPCGEPLASDEFSLRIVHIPIAPRFLGRLPLGYSLIDARERRGSLATIYLDRALWLALASDSDVLLLIGRAIAHEIGHLILGAGAHSASGLMRAIWDREELRHQRASDWVFTDHDVIAMRTAFAARQRAAAVKEALSWGTR